MQCGDVQYKGANAEFKFDLNAIKSKSCILSQIEQQVASVKCDHRK